MTGWQRARAVTLVVLITSGVLTAAAAHAHTFAVDYIVTIAATDPQVAQIRWEFSGIDEINDLILRFPADRFEAFEASGTLTQTPGEIHWVPGAPYAHITYRVHIDRQRGQQRRYDSYAASQWIVTRGRDLFPRVRLTYVPRGKERPKSRARLLFHLPKGWVSVTAHEPAGANTFRLSDAGVVLDRPSGWIALGKLEISRQEIASTMMEVAGAPGSKLDTTGLFRLYGATLPALSKLFTRVPPRILVVSAPDPMWHGGISGKDSFFVHGDRPLRTPDKTSPYLHEIFHVLQPYKPAPDADWIEEGLAEYYSLELQRRAGLLDAAAFSLGLEYLNRYGTWHVDMTKQRDNAATNNSAPLIMYAIDQRIQRATAGTRRLDDVVATLARREVVVDTERFRRAVEEVAGRQFSAFFRRHVAEGEPPQFRDVIR